VNGSLNGYPKPSGIDGFLRDHERNFLYVIFYSKGIKELNVTEVLTIKKSF
jgi:hypothetical protein